MTQWLGPEKKKNTSDFWGKELTQTTGQGLDLKQGKQWAARFSHRKKHTHTFLDSLFEVTFDPLKSWSLPSKHLVRRCWNPPNISWGVKGVVKQLVTHQVFGRFWMYGMILQVSGCQPPFIGYLWIYKPWKGQLTGKQPYLGGLLPRNLTWNLKMIVSKRNLLFQVLLFRFHVKFQGCTNHGYLLTTHQMACCERHEPPKFLPPPWCRARSGWIAPIPSSISPSGAIFWWPDLTRRIFFPPW